MRVTTAYRRALRFIRNLGHGRYSCTLVAERILWAGGTPVSRTDWWLHRLYEAGMIELDAVQAGMI